MKLNNKGFTLLEVIIAMAIMTSVIFIGYQVINKTDTLRRDQILVSNIQNGTNNLKRYVTKELKESKSVYVKYSEKNIDLKDSDKVNNIYKTIQSEINNKGDIKYKYIIKTKDKDINYIVQVTKDRNKKVYSIYRQEEKASFSLIEKQPLSDDMIPLKITEKDDLYDVQLNYIKDNTKVYSFDVYNSLLAYNDEDIDKPTDPEGPDTGGSSEAKGYFAYCINNSINNLSNLNIEDNNLKKGLNQLEELLNSDIRKDDLEDEIEYSYDAISRFYNNYYWKFNKDDYESINKALGYIYVASEVEDEINDNDNNNNENVVDIVASIKHGLYGDDNEKFEDYYIVLTNRIYSYLFGYANNSEIIKMQKLSDEVKKKLNLFRDNTTIKASEIYNDIHGLNPGLDKVKEICDESNSMIDNTINNIVYIKSTVRWDLFIEGNYNDVVYAQMDVVKIEKDLMEKLVEVKSLVHDANYYNGEM